MKKVKRINGFMFMPRWMGIFFICSHIFGWLLANAQTIWIVWEVRRGFRVLLKEIKNK